MARANVRISTAKVLDLLRTKSKEITKQLALIPVEEKKYKADLATWRQKVVASIPKTLKPEKVSIDEIRYGENSGKVRIELTYVVPTNKVGKQPSYPNGNEYALKSSLQELERTIKLLELTDDETVSASVYKNIADLI